MTKKCKNRRIFFSSYMGYGVRKMTARVWGVFLDIRTERQNAYFFIYQGFKGQKRVKKFKNDHYFFVYLLGIWGVQNDRMGVGIIFGYQHDMPKCLFFYILRVSGSKKGQKRSKMTITFYVFLWGYGVRKMSARGWGLFLDIRTRRKNAYFFIFEGVKHQNRVKKGQKSTKKFFFVYETWAV